MHFLLCADLSIAGRVDLSMLTDQNLMELFFTPNDYDKARKQFGGDENDACSWKRTSCDGKGRLTEISWHSAFVKLRGSIDMTMLPPRLVTLNLYYQPLRGEVNTSALPETLRSICIDHSELVGTVDMGNLPRWLRGFTVHDNRITAVVNICNFPETLRHCRLEEDQIVEKTVRIGRLPDTEVYLNVYRCGFKVVEFENPEDERRVYWNKPWV